MSCGDKNPTITSVQGVSTCTLNVEKCAGKVKGTQQVTDYYMAVTFFYDTGLVWSLLFTLGQHK